MKRSILVLALALLTLVSTSVVSAATVTWQDIKKKVNTADVTADKAVREKLLREAYAEATELAKAKPNGSQERLWLANAAGRLAQISGTEEKLRLSKTVKLEAMAAIKLDPKNGPAHMTLGAWHFYVSDLSWIEKTAAKTMYGALPSASYKTAEELLAKAVQLGIDNPIEARFLRARALLELDREKEAMEEYRIASTTTARDKKEASFKADSKRRLNN